MKRLMIIAALMVLAGCSDSDGARKALNGAGYSDIKLEGYRFFGCGEHDTYSTGFKAKGPTGVPVSGVVCEGVFKGATIRMD